MELNNYQMELIQEMVSDRLREDTIPFLKLPQASINDNKNLLKLLECYHNKFYGLINAINKTARHNRYNMKLNAYSKNMECLDFDIEYSAKKIEELLKYESEALEKEIKETVNQ